MTKKGPKREEKGRKISGSPPVSNAPVYPPFTVTRGQNRISHGLTNSACLGPSGIVQTSMSTGLVPLMLFSSSTRMPFNCNLILVGEGISLLAKMGEGSGGGSTWAKWGRFVIFPVLCLLAFGDTALKS